MTTMQSLGPAPMATLAQTPSPRTWQTNAVTGEQFVDNPEICGSSWWAFGHAWATTIRDDGCAECGETAVAGMSALHDLVNLELGKPLHDRDNFERMTARYLSALRNRAPTGQSGSLIANDPIEAKGKARVALAAQTAIARLGNAFIGGVGFGLAGHMTKNVLATVNHNAKVPAGDVGDHLQGQAKKLDVSGTGDFVRERIEDPSLFAPDSFRTLVEGEHRILVACLPDQWSGGRCAESQAVTAVLHPRSEQAALIDEARRRELPIVDQELATVATIVAAGSTGKPVYSDRGHQLLPDLEELRDVVTVRG